MRQKRQYGLFIKTKDGRWVRLFPRRSYVKETAVRVFQNLLLDLFFRGKSPELHPIKEKK